MALFIIYWIFVAVLFIVGLVKLIVSALKNKPIKPGLKLILVAVILVVIGGGTCAYILTGLRIGH